LDLGWGLGLELQGVGGKSFAHGSLDLCDIGRWREGKDFGWEFKEKLEERGKREGWRG
jgi:hypothetical protein